MGAAIFDLWSVVHVAVGTVLGAGFSYVAMPGSAQVTSIAALLVLWEELEIYGHAHGWTCGPWWVWELKPNRWVGDMLAGFSGVVFGYALTGTAGLLDWWTLIYVSSGVLLGLAVSFIHCAVSGTHDGSSDTNDLFVIIGLSAVVIMLWEAFELYGNHRRWRWWVPAWWEPESDVNRWLVDPLSGLVGVAISQQALQGPHHFDADRRQLHVQMC